MHIAYEKVAIKYLKSMQKPQRDLILSAIDGLTLKPAVGDIKLLKGCKDKHYRLRLGKYRIIYKYTYEDQFETLKIIDIDTRGDIYK